MTNKNNFRLLLVATVVVLLGQYCMAATQDYDATLVGDNTNTIDCITIAPEAMISWGCVEEDNLRLFNIEEAENGYIDFSLENIPDDNIDVALQGSDSGSPFPESVGTRYAFVFENGHFIIQVTGYDDVIGPDFNGTDADGNSHIVNDNYALTDRFRIEKCDAFIRFYKNEILLKEYCNGGGGEAVYHDLKVITANTTKISLDYEDGLTDCPSDPGIVGGGPTAFVRLTNPIDEALSPLDTDQDDSKNQISSGNSEQEWPIKSIVTVQALDEYGSTVKMWKIRVGASGQLPEKHELWQYIESGYEVRVYTISETKPRLKSKLESNPTLKSELRN